MNKKITLLAGAISSVLSGAALANINDIIISEYVEGSAQNKAVEISNIGPVAHTFDGTLSLYYSSYKNSIKGKDGNNVLQGKTLQSGKSMVVINGDAGIDMRASIERLSGKDAIVVAGTYDEVGHSAMNFNGDDAVWLGTTSDEAGIKDIFGTYGHSGDKLWADQSMRRIAGSKPSTTYTESQWEAFAQDAFGGLGDPIAVNDDPLPPPPQPTPCTSARAEPTPPLDKYVGEVQGEGFSSPLLPDGQYTSTEDFLVTGTVSAVTSGISKGFYITDVNADGNSRTSDGVFIKTNAPVSDNLIGQQLCVRAKVKEDYGMTTLLPSNDEWEVMNDIAVPVTPVELVRSAEDDPAHFRTTLERHEGMLVNLVQDMNGVETGEQNMRVTRTFGFDYSSYRNNMVLAYKRPNPQPNQNFVAGSEESKAQSAQNRDYRLFVESDAKAKDGQIPYYPDFARDPHNNYIRINDSVVGLQGVLHYSYNEFRLIATNTVSKSSFIANTPRRDSPDLRTYNDNYHYSDSFSIKVASQNVLNYFNSPFGGSQNHNGNNRGAESDLEFERQQAKIVEAIYNMDADIVGLMEVENNGFGDFGAINELLRAVNEKYWDEDYGDRDRQNSMHNRYVFVGFDKNGDTVLDEYDTVGGDAITTGLIYRPSKVSLVGGKVIPMPRQDAPIIVDENGQPVTDNKGELAESGKNYQRDTIAATFAVNNTGKRLTVAVNHLKSKGSTCWDDYLGADGELRTYAKDEDFQGSCEAFRVTAAKQLGTEMAKFIGDKVILGDMNSYAKEDAMLVLTDNPTGKSIKAAAYTYIGKKPVNESATNPSVSQTFGYVNAIDATLDAGETAWSYSYNDEVGSLDHLLVSKALAKRVIDVTDWHINAPEMGLFDYTSSYKGASNNDPEQNPFYKQNAFRSSDHDPVIASLGYKYGEVGESMVRITTKSDRADIMYPVPAAAQKGDIATLSLSPQPPKAVALPQVTLSKGGAQAVNFDAAALPRGEYTVTMTLTRPVAATFAADTAAQDEVIDTKVMTVNFTKRDSNTPKPVYPEYDGSGGSLGLGTLLAALGFGFLRRRRD
ncbi:hypothetical protein ATG66_1367 [Vibrio sp. ES.051]|uniref:ExeM/NucH family extracellular endonuclease n=1 Tax=Vibrio sp. ES.051 TaxID=1761909 RepID=UPI000BF3FC58|nr:ExeM/NucH family extracellular endonuclease [Vibrio sp. ES.051]PFG55105.1 hypothetical protein ATG66_1367 [Vibrio sp. ES.051]